MSGEIGWGSYEQLRGRVGFRDRNVFGTGLTAGVEAGASTKSRFVKADLLNPRILGTELSLSVPLSWSFREEPSYTEEEVELSLRLYRLFPGRVTAGVQYGFIFDRNSQLSPDVPPDARDEQHTSASIRANVDIDRRDNIFYPSRGWQTALAVEVADQRIGGTQDYVRCTAAAKFFQPLGAGFVLGLRLDSGFIVPTRGSEDIPVNDRFFTGGESSVRSFEEQQLGPKGPTGDPLGGLASTVASVEVRRRIVGNLAGSVFADVGNIAPNQSLEGVDPDTQDTADYVDGDVGGLPEGLPGRGRLRPPVPDPARPDAPRPGLEPRPPGIGERGGLRLALQRRDGVLAASFSPTDNPYRGLLA